MIAKVVAARNLSDACKKVVRNKGSAGIDGMPTTELKAFIDAHRSSVDTPDYADPLKSTAFVDVMELSFCRMLTPLGSVLQDSGAC